MTQRDEKKVLRLLALGAVSVAIGFAFTVCDARLQNEQREATAVQETCNGTGRYECLGAEKIASEKPVEPHTDKEPDVLHSLGEYRLTAYCSCEKCCGYWATIRPVDEEGNPIVHTADGSVAKHGVTVAADTDVLPFGTVLLIDGHEYIVQDRGGAIKGNRIDIYFDSHEAAREFGVKYMEIFKKEEM